MKVLYDDFAKWLTKERGLQLFTTGTIVRDSHHQKSLIHRG